MRTLAILLGLSILGSLAAAQSASSPGYFIASIEPASGGECASTGYRLEASFGAGVVPERVSSTSFRLDGGFNAVLDVSVGGQVWLSGVSPLYAPLLGGTAHTIHGHELALGPATNVTIGGRAVPVSSRADDHVAIQLPAQVAPGWQPVVATNGGGTATLQRGIGILPMAETSPPAIENSRPFRITYRGTQGDLFFIAVAWMKLPFSLGVSPYHHGLELNPGTFVGLIGPFPVLDPSGVAHLDLPGVPFPRPLYVQMLGLPAANPGYQPGSFTNTLSL